MKYVYTLRLLLIALLVVMTELPSRCVGYSARVLQADGYLSSEATSINDSGRIVGHLWSQWDDDRVVIWDSTVAAPSLIISGGAGGMISNAGDVIGNVLENHVSRAFLWTTQRDMTYLDNEAGVVGVSGLNSARQVLGSIHSDNTSVPFIWTPDAGYTEITGFNGLEGHVYGINESGQVVGWGMTADGRTHAFVWSSVTGVTDVTPDWEWSNARVLNDVGQVAGTYWLPNEQTGIFLWSLETGPSTLMQFDRSIRVDVFGINNAGVIVGSLIDDSEERPLYKAFVWRADSGLTILGDGVAYDVNNAGQIAGRLFDYGAVVWDPVPEPSGLLAFTAGLGCLAGILRRRRS